MHGKLYRLRACNWQVIEIKIEKFTEKHKQTNCPIEIKTKYTADCGLLRRTNFELAIKHFDFNTFFFTNWWRSLSFEWYESINMLVKSVSSNY